MQKVLVIGCPGAGKSTFARRLRDATGLPLYYLDRLWHRPDRTTLSRQAFDAQLSQLIRRDRWIIDGNYLRTLEIRLAACDTVFLLDVPLDECLAGAAGRIGKPREDMPWIERTFDDEFRRWIEEFPGSSCRRCIAYWHSTGLPGRSSSFTRGRRRRPLPAACSPRPDEAIRSAWRGQDHAGAEMAVQFRSKGLIGIFL